LYFVRWFQRRNPVAAAVWGGLAGGVFDCVDHAVRCSFIDVKAGMHLRLLPSLFSLPISPIMIVEGLISAAAVYLIVKVKPELLMPADHVAGFELSASAVNTKQASEVNNG
jgi:cobalt/nickel transport system permease protein